MEFNDQSAIMNRNKKLSVEFSSITNSPFLTSSKTDSDNILNRRRRVYVGNQNEDTGEKTDCVRKERPRYRRRKSNNNEETNYQNYVITEDENRVINISSGFYDNIEINKIDEKPSTNVIKKSENNDLNLETDLKVIETSTDISSESVETNVIKQTIIEKEIDKPFERTGSIKQRLAALKQSEEEGWKKRLNKKDDDLNKTTGVKNVLTKLQVSTDNWKDRVKDEKNCTVKNLDSPKLQESVLAAKMKDSFFNTGTTSTAVSVSECIQFDDDEINDDSSLITKKIRYRKVQVTEIADEQFNDFFSKYDETEKIDNENSNLSKTFDEIFSNIEIEKLKLVKKRVKPATNRNKKVIKSRYAISEYYEPVSKTFESELREFTEKSNNQIDMHKKISNITTYLPYHQDKPMLILIKGRRKCHLRLVEPIKKSINSADSYILINKGSIFVWLGEFSHLIEKRKSMDKAKQIVKARDMGVNLKEGETLKVIEEEKKSSLDKEFWCILTSNENEYAAEPGAKEEEEDDFYETNLPLTNRVYELFDDTSNSLRLNTELSGKDLSYKILKSEDLYIFDFGTEMYVWSGKLANNDSKRRLLKFAEKLWQKGYDYRQYICNPFDSRCTLNVEKYIENEKRPDWCIFAKITENTETLLFMDKFYDWPQDQQLILVRTPSTPSSSSRIKLRKSQPLKVYDPAVFQREVSEISLILENFNVSRGDHFMEYKDGIKWEYVIKTLSINQWIIQDKTSLQLEEKDFGQFALNRSYIIRWQYKCSIVMKSKRNIDSDSGRDRIAYFYWQGPNAKNEEQGLAALNTVELDIEKAPQIRVDGRKEMPAFLHFFNGQLIITQTNDGSIDQPYSLFLIRGQRLQECNFLQVDCHLKNLRSSGCFLIIDQNKKFLHLWIGFNTDKWYKKMSSESVRCICENESFYSKFFNCSKHFQDLNLSPPKFESMDEFNESVSFFSIFKINVDMNNHSSRLYDINNRKLLNQKTPRAFRLFPVDNVNEVEEILMRDRIIEQFYGLPFLKIDFYSSTCDFIIVITFETVFLWENTKSDYDNYPLFKEKKHLAMKTATNYCHKNSQDANCLLVFSGYEPLEFTNLFQYWDENQSIDNENDNSDFRKPEDIFQLLQNIENVNAQSYSLLELTKTADCLPDGLDLKKRESYLSDTDFTDLFQCSKEEFYALTDWKQRELKKNVNLL